MIRGKKYFSFKNFVLLIDAKRFKISMEEFDAIVRAISLVLDYHNIRNTEIGFTMLDPSEMRKINYEFRGIDRVTDVLSFPIDREMLGDILVCKKRCLNQAKTYGNSYLRELSYLTVHSVLHLLGYDHMEPRDKKVMRSVEKEIMILLYEEV